MSDYVHSSDRSLSRLQEFKDRYRLYIDESGDHVFRKVEKSSHRFLCLLGCWFCNPDYLPFYEALEDLKSRHLPHHPDDPVILHREAIINARRAFKNLRDDEKRRQWDNDLLKVIAEADFRVAAVVIDKYSLLQAYAKLPESFRDQHPLVIVWSHNFLASSVKKQVNQLGLSHQVFFLEWITDEELVLLYNAASLFVFPSLYEGFGLPLLEAMACGTPVLASNNSSIPEIVSDSAILADPSDLEDFCGKITEILSDEELRTNLTNRGLSRAAEFSWEKCAMQTIEVYQRVYEQNNQE